MESTRKEKYDLISVSHFFPPRVGGLENMAYNLLKGLSQRNVKCLALFGSNKREYVKGDNLDYQIFKVFSTFGGTYPLFGLRFFLNIFRTLKENPNSKVIIHSRHLTSSILTAIACLLLKHPYTVIEHNGGPVFFKSELVTRLINWVDRNVFGLVLQFAEDILAVSKTSRLWIHKNFGISKQRIGVIYNSFNTAYYANRVKEKENIVVFASKWIKVKDPQTTLDAYTKIANNFPDWKFMMIGEGSNLQFERKSLPANIEILEKLLTQEELFEILSKSKIYINSSLSEGLALGIIEAVSLGNIPILSNAKSNIEIAEILKTKDFTFQKGNTNDLVKILKKGIYLSKDAKKISAIVSKNKEAFSSEQMVETYYKRLLPRHYETAQMKILSIVIPFYNEENLITELLKKVSAIQLPSGISKEIILVDDASKDNSRNLVEKFVEKDENNNKYILLKNTRNKGKSQTVKKGVLASTGELVVVQDADLEYEPEDLVTFVNEFITNHNIDFIYGNRFNQRNKFTGSIHSLGNRFVTMASNIFTKPRGFAPKDMETCYKMVRGDIMRSIFKGLESESNFGLEPEITAKLARYRKPNGKKLNYKQIDISYVPRTISQGKKMRWFKHGVEALLEIFYFNSTQFTVEEYFNGKRVKRKF
ncbi:hypothetical protein CVU76_03155 [Candidatus Dojkabacteria bacterium HGW-Dojkabacteria-1]|uniref:Glycosyltransferase 2-like domain-containing protein n=1 Tax=Candidatus Dojkabacteria bacterium HGW-Dojkabacteria-1 TaxID=2013761 RepID=A0A2N2F497_9BACT|nr:MAG: hypothetical protein CVU76_03155 [Candidatus Dojkabacteria bacterium HGW-Dojkabacteria-1]